MSGPIPSWIPSVIDFSDVEIPSIIGNYDWGVLHDIDDKIPSVIKFPDDLDIPSKIAVPDIPSVLDEGVWGPPPTPIEDLAISVDIPEFAEAIVKIDLGELKVEDHYVPISATMPSII